MATQGDSKPTHSSDTALSTNATSERHKKRFLTHKEAEAGGPADFAACGEEDPGVALEWMVDDPDEKDSQ